VMFRNRRREWLSEATPFWGSGSFGMGREYSTSWGNVFEEDILENLHYESELFSRGVRYGGNFGSWPKVWRTDRDVMDEEVARLLGGWSPITFEFLPEDLA
jgi:hypothetical protein